MPVGNRYSGKSPTDLTGRKGAKLQREQQEKQAREQAELAAKDQRKEVDADTGIHPETGRHGGSDDLEATEWVRVSYPIDQMTYGKEVVSPPVYNDEGYVSVPAVLGPLKMFTFAEGQRYRMTPDMAGHLRSQGYLYDFA